MTASHDSRSDLCRRDDPLTCFRIFCSDRSTSPSIGVGCPSLPSGSAALAPSPPPPPLKSQLDSFPNLQAPGPVQLQVHNVMIDAVALLWDCPTNVVLVVAPAT